jgi:hypothetical protein
MSYLVVTTFTPVLILSYCQHFTSSPDFNIFSQVSGDILSNGSIRKNIHKLVWSVFITPSTFEERWIKLMEDSNLTDNAWLNDMYVIQTMWVPAYFRELPMCCLMRTTSRCESSNALFKVNSSSSNTLVQFLMSYDSSIDQQR